VGFTPTVLKEFARSLVARLVSDAFPVALEAIPSQQLKEKLERRIHTPLSGDLFLTPYWAIFVHDGHSAIGPVTARFLVYYVDRADDPRRPGGKSPDRLSDERRLTKSEFEFGLAENRRLAQINPGGGANQFMIVVRDQLGRPRRTGPVDSRPFFESAAMAAFEDSAEDTVYEEFERFVLRELANESPAGTERPIRLRF
jgi:hypothetical protein